MSPQDQDTPRGLALAIAAYLLWGFLPLYMKQLAHISPVEVVAHRMLWALPFAFLVLVVMGKLRSVLEIAKEPRTLAMATLTGILIALNWGIYTYAIAIERAADAALGYYINPLFSVFLGRVLLGERLTRMQILAICIAAAAVIVLFIASPIPPFIPLGLTLSWGFYAYFKKSLPIGPNQGFFWEVAMLSVPAGAYVFWLAQTNTGAMGGVPKDTWLLLFSGLVSAVPVIFYGNGAKLIRLSTAGILQYIAPSMILVIAVFVFKESLDPSRKIAFPMIWMALALYSVPMIRQLRRA